MNNRVPQYLKDFLNELDYVIAFTADGEAFFIGDIKTQKAVIRCYEVIGEICKRIPKDIHEANDQIHWRKLIKFRDFLAHNYEIIGLRYVWEAVEDAPNLRQKVQAILNDLDSQEDSNL